MYEKMQLGDVQNFLDYMKKQRRPLAPPAQRGLTFDPMKHRWVRPGGKELEEDHQNMIYKYHEYKRMEANPYPSVAAKYPQKRFLSQDIERRFKQQTGHDIPYKPEIYEEKG